MAVPIQPQQFHPTPSHGSSSANTHARGIHACTEQFLAFCQRIAIIKSLIRPHVIRPACHLLSHRCRLHMLDILHASTRLNSLRTGMVYCARLRAPQLLFLIRHLAFLSDGGQLGSLPTLICLITFFFFLFEWRSLELDGNIYPQAAAHLRAQSFIVPY